MLIATNLNLNQNQLLSPVLHNLTSDPSGVEGQLYVNTSSHLIRAYLNGSWTTLSTAGGTLTGSSTANYATYWSGTNAIGGIAITSGLLAHDNTGVPAAVTSTTPGAFLVASATRPLFSTATITPSTTGFFSSRPIIPIHDDLQSSYDRSQVLKKYKN